MAQGSRKAALVGFSSRKAALVGFSSRKAALVGSSSRKAALVGSSSRKAALGNGARCGRSGIGVGDDPGPAGPGQPTHDQDAVLGLVAPVRAKRWRNFSTRPVSLMRCWAPV